MSPRKTVVISALTAGLVVGGAFSFGIPHFSAKEPVRSAALSLAEGEALYAEHCASCHGANLEGQPDWRQRGPDGLLPAPPHDASGHTWHHPDPQLFAITKYGTAALVGGDYKTNMRGFGDELSDDQIWAVLRFIQSQWPEEIRRKQQEITERAQ